MSFVWLTFATLLLFIIGFLVVSLCWPGQKIYYYPGWCKFWLSVGIGTGITSITSFFTLLLAGSVNFFMTFMIEILVVVVLIGVTRYRKTPLFPDFKAYHGQNSSKILSIAFYMSLFLAVGIFLLHSLENPHGEPDAWYLWNSCARYIFRSGNHWKTTFSFGGWSHPDYPLLLPLNVVRLWEYFGKETLASPIIISWFFTFGTIGILVSALTFLRSRTQAMLGGLLLSSTPYFIKHGASQYADVPLGFYILSTLVLLNFPDDFPEQRVKLFSLAGVLAGFAAWTKNEGLLFLMSIFITRFILIPGHIQFVRRVYHRECLSFLSGVFPIMLILGYFKLTLASSNDLISSLDVRQTFERLTDLSRYLIVSKAFLRQIFEPYSLIYSTPIAIFSVYALFLGGQWKQIKRPGVLTLFFVLIFMFCGYFLIYITTPHDLHWHLGTSLSRLFLQLWPSCIMFVFMVIPSVKKGCHTLQ